MPDALYSRDIRLLIGISCLSHELLLSELFVNQPINNTFQQWWKPVLLPYWKKVYEIYFQFEWANESFTEVPERSFNFLNCFLIKYVLLKLVCKAFHNLCITYRLFISILFLSHLLEKARLTLRTWWNHVLNLFKIFIYYLLLTLLGLHCFVNFFLVVASGGYFPVAVSRLFMATVSLIVEHGL